jgi:hypothetical protein
METPSSYSSPDIKIISITVEKGFEPSGPGDSTEEHDDDDYY